MTGEAGRSVAFRITPGQAAEYAQPILLLEGRSAEAVIADKGNDSAEIVTRSKVPARWPLSHHAGFSYMWIPPRPQGSGNIKRRPQPRPNAGRAPLRGVEALGGIDIQTLLLWDDWVHLLCGESIRVERRSVGSDQRYASWAGGARWPDDAGESSIRQWSPVGASDGGAGA